MTVRFVAVSFNLAELVHTSIFAAAASELLLLVRDDTAAMPLQPYEIGLPITRDVDPLLAAVTSTGNGLGNAAPRDVDDVLASAGTTFTTTTV